MMTFFLSVIFFSSLILSQKSDVSLEKPYALFDYYWTSSGTTIRTDEVIHLTSNLKNQMGRIWTKEVSLLFIIKII
jgi:hypothetical protein